LTKGYSTLTEPEAKELCRRYSIPVPRFLIAQTELDARRISQQIGQPLVAKVVSRQILHKTEAGGVVTGINDHEEAERAFRDIIRRSKAYSPQAQIEGVLFEEMHKGVEVIVGATTDPQFGKTIVFGAGGVLVELLRDVTFRLAPITASDARNMLSEIRSWKLLSGFRGSKPVNRDAITRILEATSRMVTENPEIAELDLNPIMVDEVGAVAVDARIVLEDGATWASGR
jgi:acyl-CoA synthetase (NDP forming)